MNCYCYDPNAHSSAAGQTTNFVTVYNDTSETVRVYWMGVGWFCYTSTKDGMAFVCYSVDLGPKKAASANVVGYYNTVLVGTGMTADKPPSQICQLGQVTKDTTLRVSTKSDCISGIWSQISCQIITKIDEFSGGWVKKILGKTC